MRLKEYARRAARLPPRVALARGTRLASRVAAEQALRARDRLRPTYAPASAVPGGAEAPLARYFDLPPAAWLDANAVEIVAVANLHVDHYFDLLGSGWVQVRHGMDCRGLEGHRYSPESAAIADPDGDWLRGRLNPSNLAHAQRVWQLVQAPYTPIDWQLDFKSGYRWRESTWYRDVCYGHMPGADVKVPWELARMQHLPRLAYAHALATADPARGFASGGTAQEHPKPDTRNPKPALEFRNQVLDFIATNPPRYGVNWRCTMDVGIRVANWLVAYDLFRAAGATFDAAFESELARSVYDHGRHIADNLEWAPDLRSNHYLADVVGLLFVAAYLPRSPETDVWLAFAVQELVRETDLQFHPDGSNFEASTSYHRLSGEMVVYATALVLALPDERLDALRTFDARLWGRHPALAPTPMPLYPLPAQTECGRRSPFPPWYFERLERMAEFTLHVTGPDGHVAQIGDNDSGRFLKLAPVYHRRDVSEVRARYANLEGDADLPDGSSYWDEDPLDHRHLVAAVNGLFGRVDLTAFAGDAAAETAVVAGLARHPRVASCGSARGTQVAPHVPESMRVGHESTWERMVAEIEGAAPHQQVYEFVAPGNLTEGLELAAHPDFGLYVFRSPRLSLAVRCGSIGQRGNGGHAHNDQLHVELAIDGVARTADPGTCVYTPLPYCRNEYRSVRAHFAPYPARGGEPADLSVGLFYLGDDPRARPLHFGPRGFAGTHHGFGPPIFRTVQIDPTAVRIADYCHEPLARLSLAGRVGGSASATSASVRFSPGYGLVCR